MSGRESVTFHCDRTAHGKKNGKSVHKKVGCGFVQAKLLDQKDIDNLFGDPPNDPAQCPRCGQRMSFSIPSTTKSVNKAIFG